MEMNAYLSMCCTMQMNHRKRHLCMHLISLGYAQLLHGFGTALFYPKLL